MADLTESSDSPVHNLSKPWQKFFLKFKEIEVLKVSQWKEVHHLAHFCQRYEQHYQHPYALSLTGAPSKCTEIVFIKKMAMALGTTNARVIKDYIDWVFDHKIIPHSMKIRSLGYFMTAGLGNEFQFILSKKNKIERSTELPVEYQEIIANLDLAVTTYGELAFIQSALEEDDSEARAPYKELLNRLISLGLDSKLLKELR